MTKTPFNIYGDANIPTTGAHGANITEQRVDRLDAECLDFVSSLTEQHAARNIQAVDLGGGSGRQSMRMAALGADVLLIDLSDQEPSAQQFNQEDARGKVRFLRKDMREIADAEWPASIDCIYSQRAMNYLRYNAALDILSQLRRRASDHARLFLSMGGLETEYGRCYMARDLPIEKRFGKLSPDMAAAHGIHADICLYRESELVELVKAAGFTPITSWASDFGSPKIIAKI